MIYPAVTSGNDGMCGCAWPAPSLGCSSTWKNLDGDIRGQHGWRLTIGHRGGWVWTRTVRNNAHTHILGALKKAIHEIPYEVTGLDFDNGTEFLNKARHQMGRAARDLLHPLAAVLEKRSSHDRIQNNHLVRKYSFCYRYDTDEVRAVLNRLWKLVNDRLNYLTPTIKPTGYSSGRDSQSCSLYDEPMTHWTGCWPPGSSHQPSNQNCSPTATIRSPTCNPPCSNSPRTRPTALPRRHPHRPTPGQIRHPHPKQNRQLTLISRAFVT
jgi:hypothetical protein